MKIEETQEYASTFEICLKLSSHNHNLMIETSNCMFFSNLNIISAFESITIRISDRHKTAFATQQGHFQKTCLILGLKKANTKQYNQEALTFRIRFKLN